RSPFLYFLGFLAIIYIANAHLAEKNYRKAATLKKEIKELRWQYLSIKANVMYNSTQSQMEKRVAAKNIKLRDDGPKLILESNENQ
ncbi:MAG: FtsL-like putative cell division protein, partial [Bacteroidota bacterium]